MYRAVIFDLDGTLLNTIEDLADAVNSGLETLGYKPQPLEKFYRFVGNGAVKLCTRALADCSTNTDDISKLHELFSENYRKHCTDKTIPYEGIKEMLVSLNEKGIKRAVASNKPDEFTKSLITSYFGDGLFSSVHGKREGRSTKPSPDIVNDILKELDIEKDDVVLAGDSDVDIMTAENAGIDSIGCTWGFRPKEELASAGAVYLADSAEKLLKIVAG